MHPADSNLLHRRQFRIRWLMLLVLACALFFGWVRLTWKESPEMAAASCAGVMTLIVFALTIRGLQRVRHPFVKASFPVLLILLWVAAAFVWAIVMSFLMFFGRVMSA